MHMDGSVLSSIVKISFLFGIFGQSFTGIGTYAMAMAVAILSAFVLSGAPGAAWWEKCSYCQSLRLSGRSIPADCHHRISGGPGRNLPQCQRRYHCFHDGDQAGGRKRLAGKRIYKENSWNTAAQAAIAETK